MTSDCQGLSGSIPQAVVHKSTHINEWQGECVCVCENIKICVTSLMSDPLATLKVTSDK